MTSQFEATIRAQLEIEHRISRIVENLRKLGKDKITSIAVSTRLASLETHWNSFQTTHLSLVAKKTDELKSHVYFVDDYYDRCEAAYFTNKDELLKLQQSFTVSTAESPSDSFNSSTSGARNSVARALPKISLPKFSGDYNSWPSFRDLFTSMIVSNPDIPAVEKLHYLKNHVIGEAARRISNVAVTADNFDRAWDVLVARYENKRVLVSAYLDQLFELKPLTKKSADDLKDLIATVNEALGGLQALGAPIKSWDYFVVYFVSKRLDSESREAWELHQGNTTEPATFDELVHFLDGRTRALEMIAPNNSDKQARSANKTQFKPKLKAHVNAASTSASKCSLCNEEHYVARCPVFMAKSILERREIVNAKRLCYNCLGLHKLSECRTTKRCRVCTGQHHTLIHIDHSARDSSRNSTSASASASSTTSSPTVNAASINESHSLTARVNHGSSRATTLLATALVHIVTDHGQTVSARALLDQGSELSFVRESLVQWLRLPRRNASIPIIGVGSRSAGSTRGALPLHIRSRDQPSIEFTVFAYVLPNLTGRLPAVPLSVDSWPHVRGLSLADPTFAVPGRIDLILGADVLGQLLRPAIRRGRDNQPTAQETSLGWILFGPTDDSTSLNSARASQSRAFTGAPDLELNELLTQFWKQEEVPSPRSLRLSAEEEQCEQHFLATHTRNSSGRYIVRLPFRASPSTLGSSYSAALRMFLRLQQRLTANSEFAHLYSEFLTEYENLHHMSRLPSRPTESGYFLPHHGVLRESSTTTKLRVVFNGSCRTTTGVSLNECLHVGPKLQVDIADVIIRWRFHPYVFCADIEKMYRQIIVHPDDRQFQRILWGESRTPTVFELNTVTYGLACAPYLALRVLRQLARDESSRYPIASQVVTSDMYVDDVLSGGDTIGAAREKAVELDRMLMAGGFTLQKWTANDSAVLDSIDARRRATATTREFQSDSVTRALGLLWQPSSDRFIIQPRFSTSSHDLTKRSVLSRVAQIFDPLGWITPITIAAKIFIQELWKLKINWDDQLPDAYAHRWRTFEAALITTTVTLPRWLGHSSASLAVELHGFSDASQKALSAVVYLRVLSESVNARVSIIIAKSKVAPLKQITIPRLELSTAVLLVRLVRQVKSALQLENLPIHLWVDSTVALVWITGPASRWKEFVANRVAFIHDTMPAARWHHVAGHDNPADCASRGLSPDHLATHHLWWNGPPWLSLPSPSWPSVAPPLDPAQDLEERSATSNFVLSQPQTYWALADRYSKLSRLIRVSAWLLRAISCFRKRAQHPLAPALTPAELNDAETFWIKHIQSVYFASEISILSRGESLKKSHSLLRLAPFVDSVGLLRVGGRLRNSLLDPDAKHPILLPRDSPLTRLILDDVHTRTLHGGVQVMLSVLRQKFWILGGRTPVSAFVRRCVKCFRYRAIAAKELMGQLPTVRVTPSRPFLHSGVDYAGPFSLRTWRGRSARTYKGFLIVFICFATSAVHLELATDYSSQGFLAAYRRFTGRRGVCASLTSDCGTNFVGADAELRRLFDATSSELAAIVNHLASSRTEWRFNPPSAPHFGGKWEAAVKSVKYHLRRLLGDTTLTYEEFSTLLIQIEAVLNSRPLCPMSDDPSDLEALTPAHFLIGGSLSMIPEPSIEDEKITRLSRWQLIQQISQRFWRRWSHEYLQRLQDIAKWQHPSNQLKIGSLALLIDERIPPSKWLLGRIVETHAGSDGLVRVVTVRTANSLFKRPIVKLCPLPIAA